MSTLSTLRQLAIAKAALTQAQTELHFAAYADGTLPHLYIGGTISNYSFAAAITAMITELENEILRIVEDLK